MMDFEIINMGMLKRRVDEKRTCFNCGRALHFADLQSSNQEVPLETLQKWWDLNIIEFLCCTCYRNKNYYEKQRVKKERLLNKAKRIKEKYNFTYIIHDTTQMRR